VVEQIRAVLKDHRDYGCPRVHAELARRGVVIGKKRLHRLCRQEGFSLRRRQRKQRRLQGSGERGIVAQHPNHVWSYDFIEDRTAKGGRLRILSVIDEYHRECLALRVEPSFSAGKVMDTLRLLFLLKGRPEHLKSDNGPEFIAKAVKEWLREQGVGPIHIEPGSLWQNGTVESFHATLRQECLNAEMFANGREARQVIEDWRDYYNNERFHSALGYRTPVEYAAQTNNATEPVLSS
jgi:transposase InsO family protein